MTFDLIQAYFEKPILKSPPKTKSKKHHPNSVSLSPKSVFDTNLQPPQTLNPSTIHSPFNRKVNSLPTWISSSLFFNSSTS